MKLLQRLFGTKSIEPMKSIEPIDERPKIVVNGKVIFTIYRDGNGYYSAKHCSDQWLHTPNGLITKFEYRLKTQNSQSIIDLCHNFIKDNELEMVGEIKFIPKQ